MSLRLASFVVVMGLSRFMVQTADAAFAMSTPHGASLADSFCNEHPIAMVFANIGILALVLVLGAIVFAALAKGRNDY